MTTMIALYAAMGASSLIRGERIRKTGDRLIAAISKAEIFIGKVLGSLVANALCILLVMLFSKFVFKRVGRPSWNHISYFINTNFSSN